jgi:hypothetical protein
MSFQCMNGNGELFVRRATSRAQEQVPQTVTRHLSHRIHGEIQAITQYKNLLRSITHRTMYFHVARLNLRASGVPAQQLVFGENFNVCQECHRVSTPPGQKRR